MSESKSSDQLDSATWNSERRPSHFGCVLLVFRGDSSRGSVSFYLPEEEGELLAWEASIKSLNELKK